MSDEAGARNFGEESSGATGFAKWRSDVVAGLINAVVSVPDGLASAALAGSTRSTGSTPASPRRPA